MSSSQPFRDSSPLAGTARRKSQFTYRHLSQLGNYSPLCPLRVIAHIDLDAFYAQCEMVRLGTPKDQPLAVQQWQGLIAINYPARDHGISRHSTVTDAKKKCPTLIAQHVATWREGDDKWAYRDDAAANIQSDKVSLDPYRLQSRKILAVIKESLPQDLQKVEKASIDEVFLDLSAQVHYILLERFPELANPPPYDDPTENLPSPSVSALDWQADALVDLDEEEETVDPDWDDVAILIGSEIVRGVRQKILEKLQYTCSAGVAKNKLLSKLGSAHKKPNQQTVIRNRAVDQFLSDFKFTKMRNLGGKLGENLVTTFNTDAVSELLAIPLDQMKAKLGPDTGTWVHNTIRGIDHSEVNSRTQIKSMLSAKSFRPYINTPEQAIRWLRIFVADIFARLVEEGVLENKRRPRTMNLHHRHAGQMKSRSGPIPQGRPLDEHSLLELARNLLNQIIAEGQVWPCANLSLSVGGFEDGVTGNKGIGAFLLKGEEAQALNQATREATQPLPSEDRSAKRRRTEGGAIHRFFTRNVSTDNEVPSDDATTDQDRQIREDVVDEDPRAVTPTTNGLQEVGDNIASQAPITPFVCSRCNTGFETPEEHQSHADWHFAKDLQEQERGSAAFANRPSAARSSGTKASAASAKRGGRGGKLEQGQSRLKFG
ncbi:impB/mucB/samB family protein [Colletotrichum karsti]|uniref:DNA polymerase eta n=1 Tax=Colletotrichum karsti TaxID=1095194 RepID=A0A9P6LH64_9PEZI|nr:impB/mucB/samB family protein [Colletotrichum karsti]KAF9872207.1 impB/mucB/samB family protein [Colletotrichum karsti]